MSVATRCELLSLLAVLLAVTDSLFGLARSDVVLSAALLSSAAFFAGARTLVASSFALATPPELRPVVTSLRAATMQFGYFAGSIAGGAALAVGGYSAFGATMGLFFIGAAATLARRLAAGAPGRSTGSGRPFHAVAKAAFGLYRPSGLAGQGDEPPHRRSQRGTHEIAPLRLVRTPHRLARSAGERPPPAGSATRGEQTPSRGDGHARSTSGDLIAWPS